MPVNHSRLKELSRRMGPLDQWRQSWIGTTAKPPARKKQLGRNNRPAVRVYADDGRSWSSIKDTAAYFGCSVNRVRDAIELRMRMEGVALSLTPWSSYVA